MPIQVMDDFKDSVTSMVVTDHEIIAGWASFRMFSSSFLKNYANFLLHCRCVDGTVCTYDLRAGQLFREHIDGTHANEAQQH